LLEAARDRYGIKLLLLQENHGKGYAIRRGLEVVSSDYVCIQDADLEYNPTDIQYLLELAKPTVIVFGSRRLLDPLITSQQLRPHYLCVTMLNVVVRLLYGYKISDAATCYKLFPLRAVRAMKMECKRFEFCPELIAKASKMSLGILELPISYRARSKKEGKKITLWDALEAFWTLWRLRSWEANHTWSYTDLAEVDVA
jgi:glycosyltransferase involved in cell wall biosynthesis